MPTPVLTRSYDNGRTGANVTETVLTPDAVARKKLKRVRSFVLQDDDPRIEAQPLYVPQLIMPDGKKHDVLFVATMGNFIWAYDVDGNGVWKTEQLGAPYKPAHDPTGPCPDSSVVDHWGTNKGWGILSTPVIDLDANRLYFVNWRTQADGKPLLFAHRIDLVTMKPVGQPLPLKAELTDAQGNPVLAVGKPVRLERRQKQRAALLLVPLRGGPKTLFIATTGGENPGSPHGWMLAVDVDSFTQTAAWVSTPSSFGGGMWHASQGPASDVEGNVYAITANGGYLQHHKDHIQDFNGTTDFAEAIIRLKYQKAGPGKGSLTLDDWFIPFRDSERTQGSYDYRDQDLGSAAPVLPPDNNLLLGGGKDGILYVLDRHHLGKKVEDMSVLKSPPIYVTFNGVGLPTTVPRIDFPLAPGRNPSKTHHLHGSPAYWNGSEGPMLFTWGENESLRAWILEPDSGKVTFVGRGAEVASARLASSADKSIGGMPGGMLAVSSNGKTPHTGIVWALAPRNGDANRGTEDNSPGSFRGAVEGIARAYDATELDPNPIDQKTPRLKLLWSSADAGVTFNHAKFCTPVVADGRLFVPTADGRVDLYMLNP
jgi:outer membrane protein assembly factor BamB